MRLGILSDIHEDVDGLRRALSALGDAGVERLVFLGDVCRMSERLDETVALLASAGVGGVWGNHDFGLCRKPIDELAGHYSPAVVRYMRQLSPRLEIDGCLFTHVEPWLDPTILEDLWWFDGVPASPERVARSLSAVPHRLMFVGHFHRWFVAGRAGVADWAGTEPLSLGGPERYLVGVGAVCEGACGVFDTTACRLEPIDLRTRG